MFIFLGIPVVVLALGLVPITMYLIIAQDHGAEWVLYLVGVIIIFFQILGIQYFMRKWILEPNKMNFRQWIHWRFSPTEIRKRRDAKRARAQKMNEWYDGMDRVHEKRDQLRDEQSYDLRGEWFKNTGDPELIEPSQTEEVDIVLGDASKDDFISLGENTEDSTEEKAIDEEKEEFSWS
ncbi:MAG: hypothetical protein ACTSPM_04345 [Candidatus Heimdallarchaeota archaeon]